MFNSYDILHLTGKTVAVGKVTGLWVCNNFDGGK